MEKNQPRTFTFKLLLSPGSEAFLPAALQGVCRACGMTADVREKLGAALCEAITAAMPSLRDSTLHLEAADDRNDTHVQLRTATPEAAHELIAALRTSVYLREHARDIACNCTGITVRF